MRFDEAPMGFKLNSNHIKNVIIFYWQLSALILGILKLKYF